MAPPRIVCFGEVMVELTLDGALADRAGIGVAGDTFNTAVYLRRADPALDVAYATKLGRDALSDRIVATMEAEGLDTTLVRRSPAAMPGLYAVVTDAAGERSFLYWRSASAAREVFAEPALSFADLGGGAVLYLSAISLAILPEADRARLLDWLPAYRKGGGRVAFDSNYRPALWSDREAARLAIASAWRLTDIGLPSVDDEMALFGDADAEAVRDRLRGWGVTVGALKRGAAGPLALDGTPAGPFAPAPSVVDSTAAGDSFNAAYLAAHLAGRSEEDCLAAGHALASRVIGARGAILPRNPGGTA